MADSWRDSPTLIALFIVLGVGFFACVAGPCTLAVIGQSVEPPAEQTEGVGE